jgi:hypothetical protein
MRCVLSEVIFRVTGTVDRRIGWLLLRGRSRQLQRCGIELLRRCGIELLRAADSCRAGEQRETVTQLQVRARTRVRAITAGVARDGAARMRKAATVSAGVVACRASGGLLLLSLGPADGVAG